LIENASIFERERRSVSERNMKYFREKYEIFLVEASTGFRPLNGSNIKETAFRDAAASGVLAESRELYP
jgi:hypothetical protein